jgi:hypothetical protein
MDEEKVEKNLVNIDIIDPIGDADVVVIPDEKPRTGKTGDSGSYNAIPVNKSLGTGNLISKVFDFIAQIREKTYWKLDKEEVDSLNNTCPKILPEIIKKHQGIISCVLSLMGIIIKRIKLEKVDSSSCEKAVPYDNDEKIDPDENSLTGGRSE